MQNLFQIKIPKCRPFSIGNAKIRTVIQHHSVRCILRYDFGNLVKTHYGMVVDSEKRIRRKHFFKVVQRLGTSKVRSISKMQVANGTIADNVCNVGYDDPFDFLAGFENQYVFTRCHSRTKIRKSGYMEQKNIIIPPSKASTPVASRWCRSRSPKSHRWEAAPWCWSGWRGNDGAPRRGR